ncbi:MAG: hypothetical protein K6F98_00900 [Bacteroidales bacterium]|nr:hypothetical protein [Bacteroidales bacterium]
MKKLLTSIIAGICLLVGILVYIQSRHEVSTPLRRLARQGVLADRELVKLIKSRASEEKVLHYFWDTPDGDTLKNYLAYALRMSDTLQLTTSQYETLLQEALCLPKRATDAWAAGEDFSTRIYAHQLLSQMLTPQQYQLFLSVRNRRDAYGYTMKDWNDIKTYRVALSSDSVRLWPEIYAYQMERCIATDQYLYDIQRRKEAHKAIDVHRPSVLRQLDVVRQMPDVDAGETVQKGYQGTFK